MKGASFSIKLETFYSKQQKQNKMSASNLPLIALLGKTGDGKSSCGNVIIGQPNYFPQGDSMDSVTQDIKIGSGTWFGNGSNGFVKVVDTPGLADSNGRDKELLTKVVSFLKEVKDGIKCFALVMNTTNVRFDINTRIMLQCFEQLFTPAFWKHVVIIFTNCDSSASSVWQSKKSSIEREFHQKLCDTSNPNPLNIPSGVRVPFFFVSNNEPSSFQSFKETVENLPVFSCETMKRVKEIPATSNSDEMGSTVVKIIAGVLTTTIFRIRFIFHIFKYSMATAISR